MLAIEDVDHRLFCNPWDAFFICKEVRKLELHLRIRGRVHDRVEPARRTELRLVLFHDVARMLKHAQGASELFPWSGAIACRFTYLTKGRRCATSTVCMHVGERLPHSGRAHE